MDSHVNCPVFAKTSLKRSFSMITNERFGLVSANTGPISSGICMPNRKFTQKPPLKVWYTYYRVYLRSSFIMFAEAGCCNERKKIQFTFILNISFSVPLRDSNIRWFFPLNLKCKNLWSKMVVDKHCLIRQCFSFFSLFGLFSKLQGSIVFKS